uniref:Ovule protein n=1 Tax=Heterorhabditis bacteriophora TaxID=37862 RepID=A0A1I7WNN2_HETBA
MIVKGGSVIIVQNMESGALLCCMDDYCNEVEDPVFSVRCEFFLCQILSCNMFLFRLLVIKSLYFRRLDDRICHCSINCNVFVAHYE